MNEARQLYVSMYFKIDCIDHQIKNAERHLYTRKYQHSPMTHAKALDVVVAHDMYLECAEGELNELWNIREPMKLWEFRENISEKILTYKPTSRLY